MTEQFGKKVIMDGGGRSENFFLGLIAGVVAALVCAVIWMQVALATEWKDGYTAILVGLLVGIAVRLGGNGAGMIFGLMGAALTLAGCFGGEILTLIQRDVSPQRDFYATMMSADFGKMFSTIIGNLSALSYVAYAIGVVEGYVISIRG